MVSNKFFYPPYFIDFLFCPFHSISLFHFLISKSFVVLESDSTYDSIQLAESKKIGCINRTSVYTEVLLIIRTHQLVIVTKSH
jgi:hypothetical protein